MTDNEKKIDITSYTSYITKNKKKGGGGGS